MHENMCSTEDHLCFCVHFRSSDGSYSESFIEYSLIYVGTYDERRVLLLGAG
jgi:hypothetical protein